MSIAQYVPGLRRDAWKRNALVLLLYLLCVAVLAGEVIQQSLSVVPLVVATRGCRERNDHTSGPRRGAHDRADRRRHA